MKNSIDFASNIPNKHFASRNIAIMCVKITRWAYIAFVIFFISLKFEVWKFDGNTECVKSEMRSLECARAHYAYWLY